MDNNNTIKEYFDAVFVPPQTLDTLLADGWRHFGTRFYRYNIVDNEDDNIKKVIPLRIKLSDFKFTKSQRRILRKNEDLAVKVSAAFVDQRIHELFHNHKRKFKEYIPESIYDFVSETPWCMPCETKQMNIYRNHELIAASFFDESAIATSSIYAMFDLAESKRGLGILTALKEILWSLDNEKTYYYIGYAYTEESFYDYKKNFIGLQYYNWEGSWLPFKRIKPE